MKTKQELRDIISRLTAERDAAVKRANTERLRSAKNAINGWSEDHTLWASAIAKDQAAVDKAQCEHAKWALAACIFALRGQPIDTSRYDLPMEVLEALKFRQQFVDAMKADRSG